MATQTKPKTNSGKSTARAPKKARVAQTAPEKAPTIDPQNLEAIRFLESLDNATPEEIQEQKETWEFLKKALDENRRMSGSRLLFPADEDHSQ